MHSIERYGIVALLFLVVTVVAVLMWDGGKHKKPEELAGANPAPVMEANAPHAIDPENRLSLLAPSKPGPLVRRIDGNNGVTTPELAPETTPGTGRALGTPEAALEAAPADAPVANGALHLEERPAPEQRPIAERPAPQGRTYVVKGGDTLSEIALRELGSSKRWQEIASLNPGLDPSKLRAGKSIRLPGDARVASAPESRSAQPAQGESTRPQPSKQQPTSASRTHKVAAGENLWKIAERALGDGKRWKEIAALNPGLNPDKLVLGATLKLPAAAGGSSKSAPASKVAAQDKPKSTETQVASNDRPARRGGKVK